MNRNSIPAAGELERNARFYSVTTLASGEYDSEDERTFLFSRRCKVEPVGSGIFWNGIQVDESVTHRIWVRYEPGRTRPQDFPKMTELEIEGRRYQVKRLTDVNGAHLFTQIEAEELTDA